MAKNKPIDSEFLEGFAMAIAAIIRDHDQPGMALDIMRRYGITIESLRSAKVEGFDLRPIGLALRREK